MRTYFILLPLVLCVPALATSVIPSSGSVDLGAPASCQIISSTRGVVYQGDSADPFCRSYDPHLGVLGPIIMSVDALTSDQEWNLPILDGVGTSAISIFVEALVSAAALSTSYYNEAGAENLITRWSAAPQSFTIPIIANIAGTGFAQIRTGGSPIALDTEYGRPIWGSINLGLDFPVFERGQDAVIANASIFITNLADTGGSLSRNFAARTARSYYIYDATAQTTDTSAVPEPATAAITVAGLIGLLLYRHRTHRA
jgi:hypothetical protein